MDKGRRDIGYERRGGFRTREEGTLPVGKCPECAGKTYQVPVGDWLHWSTLTADCPRRVVAGWRGGSVGIVVVSEASRKAGKVACDD